MAKVGIELIVFQGREQKDLDGVLRECAEAGYSCVETGFIFDRYTSGQVKDICKKYNLEYAAGHGGYDTFCDEKKLGKVIKDIKDAGGSYIISSGVARGGKDIEGYKESAGVFNKAGKLARDAGLTFCYHNHAFEFETINGVKGIHVLGEETDPEIVKFNIDVSWVQIGGESPAHFINRYSNRAGYYHFKDAFIKSKDKIVWTELGKGDIDLESAYKAAESCGAKYIIYEEDVAQIEVKQAITDSRNFLRQLGI